MNPAYDFTGVLNGCCNPDDFGFDLEENFPELADEEIRLLGGEYSPLGQFIPIEDFAEHESLYYEDPNECQERISTNTLFDPPVPAVFDPRDGEQAKKKNNPVTGPHSENNMQKILITPTFCEESSGFDNLESLPSQISSRRAASQNLKKPQNKQRAHPTARQQGPETSAQALIQGFVAAKKKRQKKNKRQSIRTNQLLLPPPDNYTIGNYLDDIESFDSFF